MKNMTNLILSLVVVSLVALMNCDGGAGGPETQQIVSSVEDGTGPSLILYAGNNYVDANGCILTGYTHRLELYSNVKLDHDFSCIIVLQVGSIGQATTYTGVNAYNMDQISGSGYRYQFTRIGEWQPNVKYLVTGIVKDLNGNASVIEPALVGWTN